LAHPFRYRLTLDL